MLGRVAHIVFLRSVRRLLVTTNVVPSSPIHVTLKMEALCSPEMLVLTRATQHNIPENGILHYLYFHNRVLVWLTETWFRSRNWIFFGYKHNKLQLLKISNLAVFALELEFPRHQLRPRTRFYCGSVSLISLINLNLLSSWTVVSLIFLVLLELTSTWAITDGQQKIYQFP
jgi:hypothetical protein